jgi:putative addiction module component (TIGR02574 family)
MSIKIPDKLLKDVLALPPEVRAAMAAKLLDSLEVEVDEDVEATWRAEIEHRLREVDAGRVTTTPWSEVRKSLLRD